jgi:transposase
VRLSRAGNRRLNKALHVVALLNKRHDPRGKAYYERKLAGGRARRDRCAPLKRRLSGLSGASLRP